MQLFRVPGGEFEAARKENNALLERVKIASVPLATYIQQWVKKELFINVLTLYTLCNFLQE